MWWDRKNEVTEKDLARGSSLLAALEIAPTPTPTPLPIAKAVREPKIQDEERLEYIRVCQEVGYECGDLVNEKLVAFLHEENIHIFDMDQVVPYLNEKLGADWQWRGLRQVDVDHMGATGNWRVTGRAGGRRDVYFANRPYRGAVPLPVLLTIKKVQEAVPEVFFYISAPKNNDGDPFLLVTSQWTRSFIIERWNEPNFRER